jgi:PAS domain S-box-containing protein
MITTDSNPNAKILRQKAEAIVSKKSDDNQSKLSELESLNLIHELEVHQIELEMQNDEMQLTKERLEISLQKISDLYDFAPIGYFTLTQKGDIIELNLAGAKMLGKERSLFKYRKFPLFVSQNTRPIFYQFIEKVFASTVKQTCEVTISKDEILPLYAILTGIISDNKEYCNVTVQDITDRKMLENELIKSNEKLQISDNDFNRAQAIAHIGHWKWYLNTNELAWSDEMFNIFGIDKKSYNGRLGDAIANIIHPDDLHIVLPSNAKEFAEKKNN